MSDEEHGQLHTHTHASECAAERAVEAAGSRAPGLAARLVRG